MSRTQHILLLVGIPLVIAVGFLAAAGNQVVIRGLWFGLPHAFAVFFGWVVRSAIVSGTISNRGGLYHRATQPFGYWFNLSIASVMLIVTGLIAACLDLWLLGLI